MLQCFCMSFPCPGPPLLSHSHRRMQMWRNNVGMGEKASKQIPSWPCHEGLGRKITLGSFPMNCPTKKSVILLLAWGLQPGLCYPFLLCFTDTDVFFPCNLFSSAPSPSFSLLAALIVDFYLQSHRGHLWCQQQCSWWENKTKKKNPEKLQLAP